MFNKLKTKVTAQKFIFTFHIHVLQPWPPGTKLLAVGWQRGKNRRGSTRPVIPTSMPGRLAALVKFNESFELPATLYKAQNAGSHSPLGPFKKKCVILAILETDNSGQGVTPVGRVVIDLAEYAALDGQELKTFAVGCSKSITAAVGEPQLTITVRCRWKKAAGPGAPGDAVSMSTDTTGSNLTFGAFPSFLRLGGGGNAKPPPESDREQDLKGFKLAELPSIPEADGHDLPRTPSTTSSRDSTPERERIPPATPRSLTHTPTSQPSAIRSGSSFKAASPSAPRSPRVSSLHTPPYPTTIPTIPPPPREPPNGPPAPLAPSIPPPPSDSNDVNDDDSSVIEIVPKPSRRAQREENKQVGKSRVSSWLQSHDSGPSSPVAPAASADTPPTPAPAPAPTPFPIIPPPPGDPRPPPLAQAAPPATVPPFNPTFSLPTASPVAGPPSPLPPASVTSSIGEESISRRTTSENPLAPSASLGAPPPRPSSFAELHSSFDALSSSLRRRTAAASIAGSESSVNLASEAANEPPPPPASASATALPPPPASLTIPRHPGTDPGRPSNAIPQSKSTRSRWAARPDEDPTPPPGLPSTGSAPLPRSQRAALDSDQSGRSPTRPVWGVRQPLSRTNSSATPDPSPGPPQDLGRPAAAPTDPGSPLQRTASARSIASATQPPSPAASRRTTHPPETPASTSSRASRNGRHDSSTSSKSSVIKAELCTTAALEASVYLPRIFAARARHSGRALHAPARRIVRTIVCLGVEQGTAFGQTALKLIGQLTQACGEDVEGMAYWWGNVCHLRGFLQALDLAATSGRLDAPRHWAAVAFVEPLAHLEASLFFQALDFLWHRVLVPQISASHPDASHVSSPTARDAATAVAAARKAGSEFAVKRWMMALDAVAARIPAHGPPSHVGLMRQQLLLQCLRRVDALLLAYLLSSADGGAATPRYHELTRLLGDKAAGHFEAPVVDEAALPFGRGPLTFGVGMNVKIAVTRLQQWAFEVVVGGGENPHALDGVPLFPLLRSAADLLMMPKDLLLDNTIRQDVCNALSVRSILQIVECFQPDEFTPDVIPPEVVFSLRREAASTGGSDRPPQAAYIAPPDEAIMEAVEAGQEPGLEYDDESEDELNDMSRNQAVGTEAGKRTKPYRYRLLHELWHTGVPRRKTITLG